MKEEEKKERNKERNKEGTAKERNLKKKRKE